eukprot:CAMPEP_0194084706 /NCGR_PEP_ID=MMETSP0149-20130528/14552_1 /TAXON_ID=122233 /ORGANISM="Chaetoceros debilis, Strain MM31A-1" /LENGTH=1268 /DNA_ID=CAMNT_0038767435 /DNA_START=399 /DNA_END=4205 /DNA_ORIENTATION=+
MSSSAATATINPNIYDPISNLDKQCQQPLGRRVVVVVNVNHACLVPGGVDTVLRSERGRSAGRTIMEEAVDTSLIAEDGANGMINGIKDLSVSDVGGTGNGNPFDFLKEENTITDSTSNSGGGRSRSRGKGRPFKLATFGAKIKNTFDRGVTSIAVQAQKVGGDNAEIRDVLTVGAYIQDASKGGELICLGMTERVDMPSVLYDAGVGDVDGITFQVPILLPPHVVDSHLANPNSGSDIQFHLWMRSGAAIFAKNRALRRYVWVGSSTLRLATYGQMLRPVFTRPFAISLSLQSTVVVGGAMNLTAVPDKKFPALCGIGWSLTEPRIDTAYISVPGKRKLFNPPLDQSYIYTLPKRDPAALQTSQDMILATERLTESSVVLPLAAAFTRLLSNATEVSKKHAEGLADKLHCLDGADKITDPMKPLQQGHAHCQIEVHHFLRYPNHIGGGSVHITMNLQRPDSVFENCLASCMVRSHPYDSNLAALPTNNPLVSVPFYPKIVSSQDPRLLPGYDIDFGGGKGQVFVGKVRFQIYEEGAGGVGGDVFSPIGPAGTVGFSPRHLEATVDIDSYLNSATDDILNLNVVDAITGESAGALAVTLRAHTVEGLVDRSSRIHGGSTKAGIIDGGLISLVGMETLMDDEKACHPHSDLTSTSSAKVFAPRDPNATEMQVQADRRKRQLATMGEFLTYDYMSAHVENRSKESKDALEKAETYIAALHTPLGVDEVEHLPDKTKDPRPFRASSSRMDPLLAAIGFNVHLQTFSVSNVTSQPSTGAVKEVPTTLFQNVTCGAPSDHFRGFSSKGSDDGGFAGGLRRLEAFRIVMAEQVKECQDNLIDAVSTYYQIQSQHRVLPGRSQRHIPPTEHIISQIRTSCFDATERLHNLTWEIAVRRGNCFSQALGIAVTMYLSHVSDLAKLQKAAWVELWCRHGFLITFEGLLSAAGKELGMIEDASVGIAMLRMVSVVIVTEGGQLGREHDKVQIIDSPYLRWLRITPSGQGSNSKFLVEICVDDNFHAQRIPPPLKNKKAVQFYPVLYEMGVDIRQWGSNAGANFGKKSNEVPDEMDEDEVGIPDNDFLMALNYDAFRKMNGYAHAVYLCGDPQKIGRLSWEQAHFDTEQQIRQPIHPMLSALHDFIRSSATKIEHGILDEAAYAAARLGGGSAIFCKSGKDRTAMQVTFKQAQFINRFMKSGGNGFSEGETDADRIFSDATTMRVYGTRLPICDKNVGQPLYAFNSLQARFMPDPLKPPARTLAGFLKGGRVFTGGAIES